MALDIQNIVMTSSYVPYERPPQPYTLWSAIPRGLQSFIVATALLDAKALNDDALLNLTATLPPNFAYVLNDINFNITQDTAFAWADVCTLNLQSFYRAEINESVALSCTWRQDFFLTDIFNATNRSMQVTQPWPSFPMIGTPGTTGIQCVISSGNPADAAALAGTVNAYMSWWQFDLEQVRKYPINSPQPVHAR